MWTIKFNQWARVNFCSYRKINVSFRKGCCEIKRLIIGHFRVLLCLCFETSLSAKPFTWKWVLHANQRHFIRMVLHLDSLWNKGTRELRNGLLFLSEIRHIHCKTVLVASLSQLDWEYREIELRAGGEGINHLNFVFPEKFHVRTDEENTLLSKMTWQSLGTV